MMFSHSALTHCVSANFVPTRPTLIQITSKITPARLVTDMRCPYHFPVSLHSETLTCFLCCSWQSGLLHCWQSSCCLEHRRQLVHTSSTSEAFTGRRPWPVFHPRPLASSPSRVRATHARQGPHLSIRIGIWILQSDTICWWLLLYLFWPSK